MTNLFHWPNSFEPIHVGDFNRFFLLNSKVGQSLYNFKFTIQPQLNILYCDINLSGEPVRTYGRCGDLVDPF